MRRILLFRAGGRTAALLLGAGALVIACGRGTAGAPDADMETANRDAYQARIARLEAELAAERAASAAEASAAPVAPAIADDDSACRAELAAAQDEVERYRIGLEKAVALLNARQISSRPTVPGAGALASQSPRPSEPAPAQVTVVHTAGSVTQRGDHYWRFGWQVTLLNPQPQPVQLSLEVQLLSADGFVIDTSYETGIYIRGDQRHTVTGDAMLEAKDAPNVAMVRAVPEYVRFSG